MSPLPPVTRAQLFARLDELGIAYRTHDHVPVFTVEGAKALRGTLPGGHCKNLFLKDKKDRLYLIVALEERKIEINGLAKRIGAARLSFGNADLLLATLGVTPGSVTPFSVINDREHRVHIILDAEMLRHDPVNYHPLVNDQTTALSPKDLIRFIESCGHRPLILDFDSPG